MKTVKELTEARVEIEDKIEVLVSAAEKAELTAEQKASWKSLQDEITAIDEDLAIAKGIENRNKAKAAAKISARTIPGAPQDNASENKELSRYSYVKAFADIKNNGKGLGTLEGFEKEIAEEAIKEAKEAGIEPTGNILLPSSMVKYGTEKSLLDVATEGVDLVRTEYRPMIPSLRIPLVADQFGVTKYNGLKGNIKIPRETNEATFVWETENSSADEFTLTYDAIDLSPKRLAGYTDISGQMLVQSNEITENYLRSKIQYGVGSALDLALIAGPTGGNSPVGIINFSGVNIVSLGSSGGDMTYGAIVALIAAVSADNAREGNAGFAFNTNGFASLALTPYQTNGVEGNFILKPGTDTLWGRKYIVTNRVPSDLVETTTGLSAMVYSSNWKSAIIATWGGVGILFDPYTQALVNKIRIVVNTYADVDIEHPEEFSVVKDWNTTLPALT